MSFEISLFIEYDPAVVGEHVPLRMLFTNASEGPLTVPDPERSRAWPRVMVRDLDRNTETITHRTDIEALGSHEFRVPLPETFVTLAPGAQLMVADDLLRWVPPLSPGRYALAVWLAWDGGQAVSRPVLLTVEALHDVATVLVSSHSGNAPNRYVVSAHDTGAGTLVTLSLFMLDPTGEHHGPASVSSARLAVCARPVRPFLSVTANALPYPAHWVAWFDEEALWVLFERQGKVELPLRALPWESPDAAFATPILHDLHGNDGTTPGRALLAWWSRAAANVLSLDVLDGAGVLDHTGEVTFDQGAIHTVHAWLDRAGAPTWLTLLQHEESVLLAGVRSADTLPNIVARAAGTLLTSAVTLLPDDTVQGAMVLRLALEHGIPSWGLQRFTLTADGECTLHEARRMTFERARTTLTGARLAVSPQGDALALLRADDGEWWLYPGATGRPEPLAHTRPTLEAPDALTWMGQGFFFVTTAPAEGVTFHEIGEDHP